MTHHILWYRTVRVFLNGQRPHTRELEADTVQVGFKLFQILPAPWVPGTSWGSSFVGNPQAGKVGNPTVDLPGRGEGRQATVASASGRCARDHIMAALTDLASRITGPVRRPMA